MGAAASSARAAGEEVVFIAVLVLVIIGRHIA
jgi:hypothetical protein